MGLVRTILLTLAAAASLMGCSRVGFQSEPKQTCSSSVTSADTSCIVQGQNLSYSFSFQTGQVDILFVDDNSGSMYQTQVQMASAFSSFISSLSNLNYQIAVVTTDISDSVNPVTGQVDPPSSANGYGAFQDGQFLSLTDTNGNSSGSYVLTNSTPNGQDLFSGTIERQETLDCENNDFQPAFCASDVPRGIYAVNDAIAANQDGFFRPGAPLAVVILSDSDECENGVSQANCGADYANDEPSTLVQNMTATFPTQSLAVYSIVVPNQQCLLEQKQKFNGIWNWGILGNTYMSISDPGSLMSYGNIVPGVVGDICDTPFTSQLSSIGSMVKQQSQNAPIQLACNPQNLSVTTTPASAVSQLTYSLNSQNELTFSNTPNGITVNVSYQCSMY